MTSSHQQVLGAHSSTWRQHQSHNGAAVIRNGESRKIIRRIYIDIRIATKIYLNLKIPVLQFGEKLGTKVEKN